MKVGGLVHITAILVCAVYNSPLAPLSVWEASECILEVVRTLALACACADRTSRCRCLGVHMCDLHARWPHNRFWSGNNLWVLLAVAVDIGSHVRGGAVINEELSLNNRIKTLCDESDIEDNNITEIPLDAFHDSGINQDSTGFGNQKVFPPLPLACELWDGHSLLMHCGPTMG